MTDREKLFALITEALHRKEGEARVVGDYYTNRIADYLIANGVTFKVREEIDFDYAAED